MKTPNADASWKRFAQRTIAVLVATGCAIAVLLVTADDPSMDEITRGGPAGAIGYFLGRLMDR